MPQVTLTYFDFPGGRGEDCRLALHIAGVDFEDNRIKGDNWAQHKGAAPFGALPVLEVEGKGKLGQSNAILQFIGLRHDLHPSDDWKAAQHQALMDAVEELRGKITPVLKISEDRETVRKEFMDGYLKAWSTNVERNVSGPFVDGDKINVVDLKLFGLMRWFIGGGVDHIPKDVFAPFPKLTALFEAVQSEPRVRDWYA